ncbi:hypothetical protein V5799_008474 [Amblyomma americanum]|uniref:Uncharacterized protein n=1 Tax=Amblyomma americanum TaxID=6943 RepID=A0AAQ4E3C8_AMBAM
MTEEADEATTPSALEAALSGGGSSDNGALPAAAAAARSGEPMASCALASASSLDWSASRDGSSREDAPLVMAPTPPVVEEAAAALPAESDCADACDSSSSSSCTVKEPLLTGDGAEYVCLKLSRAK